MKFFSCLVIGFTIILNSNWLISGPITSGGGNSEAASFQSMAYKIRDYIENYQNSFPEIDLKKLDEAIKSAQVLFVYNEIKPENYPSNVVLDAYSDGNTRIIKVNLMRWQQKNYIERQVTILHEYLVLMGIENYNNYFVSSRLFESPISFNDSVYEKLEENSFFRRQKRDIFKNFEDIIQNYHNNKFNQGTARSLISMTISSIKSSCITVVGLEQISAEKSFFKRINLEKRLAELEASCLAHFSPIFQFVLAPGEHLNN